MVQHPGIQLTQSNTRTLLVFFPSGTPLGSCVSKGSQSLFIGVFLCFLLSLSLGSALLTFQCPLPSVTCKIGYRMGDTTKTRSNPTSKRGPNATGSSVDIRSLLSRSEINTRLSSEPNPVSNVSKAKSWLETKGWILAGENYSKPKLADILFTVALTTKLTPEASSAIKAVALLIEDLVEEDFLPRFQIRYW